MPKRISPILLALLAGLLIGGSPHAGLVAARTR
jgi:hypothetical protein